MIFGQEGVLTAAVGLPIQSAHGPPAPVNRAIEAGGEGSGSVSPARPQQLGPSFGAIGAVFGQEGVHVTSVGLPVERAIGIPTDVDRAIDAGGEGSGLLLATRAQQLGPGFCTVSAVFGQEGVVRPSAVGLPIERASGCSTDVNRAIQAGSEGVGTVIAARPQQLSPGFGATCAVFGEEGLTTAAAGLPIEFAIGLATNVNRAIEASGEGMGPLPAASTKQLGPGFGAVGAVFGQEGVVSPAIGIAIKPAKGSPTDVDRTIAAGGEGRSIVIAARPQQFGPSLHRSSSRRGGNAERRVVNTDGCRLALRGDGQCLVTFGQTVGNNAYADSCRSAGVDCGAASEKPTGYVGCANS